MTNEPSLEQEVDLENFGLEVLPSESTCRIALRFIRYGNTSQAPKSQEGRIELLKAAQRKWNGQRIRHPEFGSGLVRYVCPHSVLELNFLRRYRSKDHKIKISAMVFKANVRWDHPKGKHSTGDVALNELDLESN